MSDFTIFLGANGLLLLITSLIIWKVYSIYKKTKSELSPNFSYDQLPDIRFDYIEELQKILKKQHKRETGVGIIFCAVFLFMMVKIAIESNEFLSLVVIEILFLIVGFVLNTKNNKVMIQLWAEKISKLSKDDFNRVERIRKRVGVPPRYFFEEHYLYIGSSYKFKKVNMRKIRRVALGNIRGVYSCTIRGDIKITYMPYSKEEYECLRKEMDRYAKDYNGDSWN
jgi:hypothetical protein